jgi:hypothetical protein
LGAETTIYQERGDCAGVLFGKASVAIQKLDIRQYARSEKIGHSERLNLNEAVQNRESRVLLTSASSPHMMLALCLYAGAAPDSYYQSK